MIEPKNRRRASRIARVAANRIERPTKKQRQHQRADEKYTLPAIPVSVGARLSGRSAAAYTTDCRAVLRLSGSITGSIGNPAFA